MVLSQLICSGIMLTLLFLLPVVPAKTPSRQPVATNNNKMIQMKGSQIHGNK